MNTTTNNTTSATSNDSIIAIAVHDIFAASQAVDTLTRDQHGVMATALEVRKAALKVLTDMGFKSIQSGAKCRYDESKGIITPPALYELSYYLVKADSAERMMTEYLDKSLKAPTENQLKARLNQDIEVLKVWLTHSKFTTNPGRDLPKLEYETAEEMANTQAIQLAQARIANKAAAKTAADSKKQAERTQTAAKIAADNHTKLVAMKASEDIIATNATKLAELEKAKIEAAAQVKADINTANATQKTLDRAKIAADKAIVDLEIVKTKSKAKSKAKATQAPTQAPSAADSKDSKDNVNISPLATFSKESMDDANDVLADLEAIEGVTPAVLLALANLIQEKYQG